MRIYEYENSELISAGIVQPLSYLHHESTINYDYHAFCFTLQCSNHRFPARRRKNSLGGVRFVCAIRAGMFAGETAGACAEQGGVHCDVDSNSASAVYARLMRTRRTRTGCRRFLR